MLEAADLMILWGKSVVWYCVSISLLSLIPAVFGTELGFRRKYIETLVHIFNWATNGLSKEEEAIEENSNELEKRKRKTKHAFSIDSLISISSNSGIIDKKCSVHSLGRLRRPSAMERPQHLQMTDDAIFFISSGIEAIVDDDVTQCFHSQQLGGWNLLARTNHYNFTNLSPRMTFVWIAGFIWRWMVMFPWRVIVCLVGCAWMLMSMSLVSFWESKEAQKLMSRLPTALTFINDERLRLKAAYYANIVTYRIYTRALGAVVNYHDRQNMPKNGSVCVANHTTIIDVITLSNDRPYAMIGQSHGGALGWWQRNLTRCTKHIWFERSELRDRQAVSRRLRDHCLDERNYPLLIFPEGTCVNNTSVLQFKKGSFEACEKVHPVAIKYNPWFGDAFWNSSRYTLLHYLMRVFTSWAILADVYYLPVMSRGPGEDAIDFANRCKREIAAAGGLVDRVWDGQLKRSRVKQAQKDDVQKEVSQIVGDRLIYQRGVQKLDPLSDVGECSS